MCVCECIRAEQKREEKKDHICDRIFFVYSIHFMWNALANAKEVDKTWEKKKNYICIDNKTMCTLIQRTATYK